MKKIKLISLLLALLMAFSLCACGQADSGGAASESPSGQTGAADSPAAAEPEAQGGAADTTFIIGSLNAIEGFNLYNSNNAIGMMLVYDTPMVYNPETGEIEGLLVDTYEYLSDTTLKLTFKEGITYSNGDPMLASDFLWTWKQFATRGSAFVERVSWIDLDNSYAEDDRTLIIETYEPYGPGISMLCNVFLSPLDEAYESTMASTEVEHFWDTPVGTGPYKVKEIVSGDHITYERRDDYWGAAYGLLPDATEITVKYYAEPSTMYNDFETGAIDAAFKLATNDAERLINNGTDDDFTFVKQSGNDVYMLCLGEYTEYFQNENVRKAICMAVNAEEVGNAAAGILAIPATSTLPSTVNYYVDVGGYEYDPDTARELLEQEGYSDLTLRIVMISDPVCQAMAEAVQANLRDVGVTLKIEAYDIPTAVPMFMTGDCDMVVKNCNGGADLLEPNQIYGTMMISTTNTSARLSDPTLNGYWDAGLYSVDPEVRAENYALAQQYIHDHYMAVPCFETQDCFVYWNRLDMSISNVTQPNLRYVHFN